MSRLAELVSLSLIHIFLLSENQDLKIKKPETGKELLL